MYLTGDFGFLTDTISSESEIEIPRGGSDEENKKPTKSRARLKRPTKGNLSALLKFERTCFKVLHRKRKDGCLFIYDQIKKLKVVFPVQILCSTITAVSTSRSDSPDTEVPRMSGSLMKLSLASDLIGSPVLHTPPKSREGNRNMYSN